MSTPQPLKRRRVDDATRQLKKPFVSPLRRSKTDEVALKENRNKANTAAIQYTPSTAAHSVLTTLADHAKTQAPPAHKPQFAPPKSSPIRKQILFTSSAKKTAPDEMAAQKAITALELRVRKIQSDLDVLERARQIRDSAGNAELEELTGKWRHASQAVAEELFGTVKERVCRMGGVAAWRETEKRKHDRSHGSGDFAREAEPIDNDADCEFDSQGEELPEEEQEFRRKMKRQAQREALDAADVQDVQQADSVEPRSNAWQDGGEDDDTFTMDMMLRSLNIQLSVIGYDKQSQRWTT